MNDVFMVVWGRDYLDGYQFVYKHESTGEILNGVLTTTPLANIEGGTDLYEYTLYPNEYITEVRGREGCWVDALELHTVCGRIFRVGGYGGHSFNRQFVGVEVRYLVGNTQEIRDHICHVSASVSPARLSLSPQIFDSCYQVVLRHGAFRVHTVNMWAGTIGFAGIQMIFQRKVPPYELYAGYLFGETFCSTVDPAVSVQLGTDEYLTMALCRLADDEGIFELRFRTNFHRNISCGSVNGDKFVFACHTMANCEVRGLRQRMIYSPCGLNTKLSLHEIRLCDTYDATDFDSKITAMLLLASDPTQSAAVGVTAPLSFEDDAHDDIDFEDETFSIPANIYDFGIPSITDVESSMWELKNLLGNVRRDGDECRLIVDQVIFVYDNILALHNREIAYAGLLVIRLLDLIQLTVRALEKSAKVVFV
ncbi:Aste57867_13952 [Aphanomyces stellatus]|uniref:Aste57867_13952 protein n=1 Tax=Aphanomyces stellatus TaxID=120398 RepID=A0A485KZF0_9STRA|nr:hypothetical protein As57867_013901 [Aphanomyces stellatus]VFT90782.1 Aste57867_13952 [Aphanomyces stellatus]